MKRSIVPAVALALLALVGPAPAFAQAKDTLTVALVSHAPTLDPHMHFERVGILVNINMFDSLLHRSTKLQFEPSLATSWKAVTDTQWEFKIRKGVRFHNGDVLTPSDFKYSFDRVLDQTKKSPQYGNIRAIKEVKVVDAETVHIITDKPFPLLLERLVFFPIVSKKHVEAVGDQAFGTTSPVGTGPWKFVEWKRDQLILLEAFDQHWRGRPPFKHLIFRAVPETATQVAEVKTGGVDIIRDVSADLIPELKTHPQAYISSTPILRVHYVNLDMRSVPFDKKPVRQAANYAIDKATVIQKMMAGLGTQVATTVQPLAFGFEAMAQMLTEVGIRATPRMWDPGPAWNKFLQAEGKATQGMYGTWGNYSVFDADAVLHPLYHNEPGGWIGRWYARVEGLDKLIDEARSTVDQPKRKRLYSQIQQMIREEAPSIFLWTQYDTLGISKKVQYAARPDEWLWLYDAKPAAR